MKYNHKETEKKWGEKWFASTIYHAEDFSEKPKKFILVEFPYPSGSKLHMGHVMRYTIPEIYSRKLRMSGYNVLFPMGWDAFGLPAENYAVKTGVHPAITTNEAVHVFRNLFQQLGFSFDWSREINTTDPEYYKWTQWIFLKFWEQGLAELKQEPVWWCENLKTILANEEVIKDSEGNLVAERDGKSSVERRLLKQWVLKIPEYADKLIDGLKDLDFPESIKAAQTNWIGRSEGAEVDFEIEGFTEKLTVFTTRIDTIFGATFIVVAPEHPVLEKIVADEKKAAVTEYQENAKQKSELDRTSLEKTKTGIFTGAYAINPFSGKKVPIWTSDFVVTTYGTGAIMGVPAHDERDYEFADKFGLEKLQVVFRIDSKGHKGCNNPECADCKDNCECGDGRCTALPYVTKENTVLANSGDYSGLSIHEATERMLDEAVRNGFGRKKINFKLRDWLFSRQRYWGEPIPLVHKADGSVEAICDTSVPVEVSEKLPLLLPDVPDYTPSSDASSPLSKNSEWVQTHAKDGTPAMRETNTMPNWAGSCWYYLRFIDPKNTETFADREKMKYWLPVDQYFGGSEHTTLHLLYSRFWHKFLFDMGEVPTPEPYTWRMNGGILLGPDGEKMSKSRGNVINPDENIEKYGVDALRTYVCFMGPYDATIVWNEGGLRACRKMIEDIIDLQTKVSVTENESSELTSAYHIMNKKVSAMIDNLKMNTAISEFMIFINLAKKERIISQSTWKDFLKLIAPFAPFIAEELWQRENNFTSWTEKNSVHAQSWPDFDETKIKNDSVTIGIQINGKLRSEIQIHPEEDEASIKEKVFGLQEIAKWTENHEIKKFIYIKGKIVNIVI